MTTTEHDVAHMRAALNLAARGLGRTWPNPSVGCVVIDRSGAVVGRGHTQPGGRPHAEAIALARAGASASGGTVYVTLEPCAHHGQTPPCAEALVKAGVERCLVAVSDPDPRVAGKGIAQLREAGIAVESGVLAAEAKDLNRGFFTRLALGRPMVALKLATTQDGKIAAAGGHSQWITGARARDFGHWLRANHDAIAVGSGTIIADDPSLTARLPGLKDRSPIRVVFDRRGRTPPHSKVLAGEGIAPTWFVTTSVGADHFQSKLNNIDQIIEIKSFSGDKSFLDRALAEMGQRGVTRLLVEGGATLSTALLKSGLVDRLYWFRSPMIVGDDGLSAVRSLPVSALTEALRWRRVEFRVLGEDVLEVLDYET